MPVFIAYILGSIVGIAATVLACIYLFSEEKAAKLNNFWYTIHNLINFKTLIIEKILKVLYVLATCSVIGTGFFMLFSVTKSWGGTTWNGIMGLILMIIGPFIVRLIFELFMMFIVLVDNSSAIRKKLTGDAPAEPERSAPAPANYVFCNDCGTRYNETEGGCPKCSAAKAETAAETKPEDTAENK